MLQEALWKRLWDYDPNGLVAVDGAGRIRLVNPAFCRMFRRAAEEVVEQPAAEVLGDDAELRALFNSPETVRSVEKEYPAVELFVRQVMFAVRDEGIVAAILVDLTEERRRQRELERLKRETLEKVRQVVDHQMKVAQEIAGLLGETTAETKASLLKLMLLVEGGAPAPRHVL